MIGPDSSLRAFSHHEVLAGGQAQWNFLGRSQGLGESVSEEIYCRWLQSIEHSVKRMA
jgi:hypothetical protein